MPTFLPKFRKFLIENRVFIMVIGFLMSEEIRRLTRTIVDNLIEPILDVNNDQDSDSFFEKKANLNGISFGTGAVLKAAVNFIIIIVIALLISYLAQDILNPET